MPDHFAAQIREMKQIFGSIPTFDIFCVTMPRDICQQKNTQVFDTRADNGSRGPFSGGCRESR